MEPCSLIYLRGPDPGGFRSIQELGPFGVLFLLSLYHKHKRSKILLELKGVSLAPSNNSYMTQTEDTLAQEVRDMPMSQIANRIRKDWKNIYFGAVPYLDAMSSMSSPKDKYGYDDGKSIVLYFLSNATTWRGPVAKTIKAELKRQIK